MTFVRLFLFNRLIVLLPELIGFVIRILFSCKLKHPQHPFFPTLMQSLENAMLIGVNIDADPQHLINFYSANAVLTFIKLDENSRAIARITSGEWDEDIPTNIAPVMDRFINQEIYYKK